jgi:hypothetical protein
MHTAVQCTRTLGSESYDAHAKAQVRTWVVIDKASFCERRQLQKTQDLPLKRDNKYVILGR